MFHFNFQKSVGKTIILSFALALFFAFEASAQMPMQGQQPQQQEVPNDFSSKDLESFATVYVKATEVQKGNEEEMIKSIEEEDLEIDRFNEILTAQQQQQAPEEVNASAEEMAAFNNAIQKVMKIQQDVQVEIEQMIESEIGTEKYQQIVLAYQQNPEVQEKINTLLQEKEVE